MALILKSEWCKHCRERITLRRYAAARPLPGFPAADSVDLWVNGNGAFPGDQSLCEHHDIGDDIGSYGHHEPAGNSLVVSVWSAYGHRFLWEDGRKACFACGAVYDLVADSDDPTRGEYVNRRGDAAMSCADLRDLVHGIERNCEVDNGKPCNGGSEPCEHTDHDCNCLQCQT